MRANPSRLRCGTLAAPYNSSTSTCTVEAGKRAARLHRYGAVPADGQIESDDPMRRSKGCLDIAVTGAQHQRLRGDAGCETAGSRTGVQYRGQLIGLDRDKLGAVFGQIGMGREHSRYRLADITQPLAREKRLAIRAQRLGGRIAKIDGRQVGRCPPQSTPRQLPARPVQRSRRRTAARHSHKPSARCAYAADAGRRYRR